MAKQHRARIALLVEAKIAGPTSSSATGKAWRRKGRAPSFQVERCENRVLLSSALPVHALVPFISQPTFVAYQPQGAKAGVVTPFSTAAPTGLTPTQMRHAYGVDQINFDSTVGDGTGQTIAIVDAFDQPNAADNLNSFSQFFGLPLMNQSGGPTFTKVDEHGGTSYPGADAPGGWGVEITLDIEWAHVIAPRANILLVEAASATDSDLMAGVDTARNYVGVSVVSMSWGASESSSDLPLDARFATPANHNGVTFFASTGDSGKPGGWPAYSPNVVAVGGTTLNVDPSGNYLSESGWSGSGGGISTQETQPSYQTGVVTQSSTKRTIPDIAMDADPNTGVPIYDTYDFSTSAPWAQYGGTSLASPMAAAEVAIANQGDTLQSGVTLDGRSGTLPSLYTIAAANFHDVITGNNGFAAGPGYDLVTGRGTPTTSFVLTLSGYHVPHLAFGQQPPASVTAGVTITPSVTVDVLDGSGNLNTSDNSNVTISLAGNGTLNGTLTVAAVNGVATFSDLSINVIGTYTLQASDGVLGTVLSHAFTVNAGAASKLAYVQAPTATTAGATIAPPVTVAVEDAFGNVVTANTSAVTVGLASAGTLSGTLTENAANGVATFADLSIQTPGVYTLVASDGSLVSITSGSFQINPPPARVLSINRLLPLGPLTSDTTVEFDVLFNEPVTGVGAGDFALVLNGVTVAMPIIVAGSGDEYTVTVSGISSGSGSVGLNLSDNGSIRDVAGNPLQGGGKASFQSQSTFTVGTKPASVAVGDVNRDGIPDMVVANSGANSVSVLLGVGNGAFQPQQTFATGRRPASVVIADVNSDGRPDLVVANNRGGTVSVLLGNGNGSFQTQRAFATGAGAFSVAVADVNGDGKPDLIVSNSSASSVSVLLGNGDGTFQTQRSFATGYIAGSVAVADINGDGKPDLVVVNYGLSYLTPGNTVSVLLGNGDGTFQSQVTYETGQNPQAIAIADINGDGKPDLIVGNTGSSYYPGDTISILLGNGNGTFQTQQALATGDAPASIVATDVNGDGKIDLVVANDGSGTVSVLLGNGDGVFQPQQSFATGSSPDSVAVADVNGDGRADLVVANYSSKSVSVLLCNSNGNFTGQIYTIVPSLDTINGSAAVDPITLTVDPDHVHIDWTLGTTIAQTPINDPGGLTINGNGSNDTIYLDYSHGVPLPNRLNLNGVFTLNNLATTGNALANTTIDLEQSTLFITYVAPANDPLALIQGYLKTGYNNGLWTGASANGSIVSSAAAANVNRTTAIGYADSADGSGVDTMSNSIELKYTLYGDTGLTGTVGFTDFMRMTQHMTLAGITWGAGDFNYDGMANSNDFNLLQRTYGQSMAPAALPSAPATNANPVSTKTPSISGPVAPAKHKRLIASNARRTA